MGFELTNSLFFVLDKLHGLISNTLDLACRDLSRRCRYISISLACHFIGRIAQNLELTAYDCFARESFNSKGTQRFDIGGLTRNHMSITKLLPGRKREGSDGNREKEENKSLHVRRVRQ